MPELKLGPTCGWDKIRGVFVSEGGFASDAYDCFVVGSGPAGMSVALALAEAKKRVLIFESGDEQHIRPELANSIGYGHFGGEHWNAHSIRMLGGSSNVWAGQCPTPRHFDCDQPRSRCELAPPPGRSDAVLETGGADSRPQSGLRRFRAHAGARFPLPAAASRGANTRRRQVSRDAEASPVSSTSHRADR